MDSLASYNALLNEYKEQLRDLKLCKERLLDSKADFQNQKRFIDDPELSAKTWYGKTATKFNKIRNERILTSYADIANEQLNGTIDILNYEMTRIANKISMVKQKISDLEAE